MSSKAWVASKPCGCVSMICAEDWLKPADMRDWGKRGLTARLVPDGEIRNLVIHCPAHPQVKQEELFLGEQFWGVR